MLKRQIDCLSQTLKTWLKLWTIAIDEQVIDVRAEQADHIPRRLPQLEDALFMEKFLPLAVQQDRTKMKPPRSTSFFGTIDRPLGPYEGSNRYSRWRQIEKSQKQHAIN